MINFNPELPKLNDEETHNFEGWENKDFPIWRSLEIGTGVKTGDEFVDILQEKGFRISPKAKTLLMKIELTERDKELHLIRVTPRDLGFKEMPSIRAINKRAKDLGLTICPAAVGPYLREEYTDQPKNTWLHVGMNPVTVKTGKDTEDPISFALIEENGFVLHSSYNENVQVYDIDSPFVFLKSETE